MILMDNLKNTSSLVKYILENDDRTRNSDNLLYLKVLETLCDADINADVYSMPVAYFLIHMADLGFPPFESVRRTRQKIQHEFPELAASKEVMNFRKEKEQEYFNFSIEL